ncbi:disulfide bond formation protein B, partial [Bradyrhizobium sp. PRIMUS42]|uniref:disulfide bond formation protein B n=1 Tax=Bradyrhizobium sp. PRIMUS42 TaxID=2908926 RepID=UPI001FF483D5
MTTQSAAIPAFKPAAGGSALTASLLVTLIAAATIAGAWFFQLVLEILPCPLCLEQRYAYSLAIPLGALKAIAARAGAPRPL